MPDQDPYVDTVDEIAAALRHDPVLVQDAMGNGHTGEIHDALTELADDAGVPVYVVLAVTPRDLQADYPAQELVHVLHGRLGDGIYLVGTTDNSTVAREAYGVDLLPGSETDSVDFSLGSTDALGQVYDAVRAADEPRELSSAGEVAASLAMLRDDGWSSTSTPLTDAQVTEYSSSMWTVWDPYSGDRSPGDTTEPHTPMVVGVATALVVTVLGYRLLQSVTALTRAHRGRQDDAARHTDRVRADARTALALLDERLTTAPATDPTALEAREVATTCRDAASDALDGGPLDVVAALVLARSGIHAVDRPGEPPYACCFFNPLHGAGTRKAAVGGRQEVPVCTTCANRLGKRRQPQALLEERVGVDLPYYEGTSVWAATGFGSLDPGRFRRTRRARS